MPKTTPKAEDYTYRVFWSSEDSAYISTVAEFPSLSSIEATQEAALAGMVELLRFILKDMQDSKEDVPLPFWQRSYSGNLRLRLPVEQHRRLAIEAAEQGVSMNSLILSRV